jgi:diacylglycerol kinase (ATP)
MRAAAIFGLGSSTRDLKPFKEWSSVTWQIGLPESGSDADAIVLFGGDGTLHRHLPQLVKLHLPVLIVPRGSGNDFARSLNIRSFRQALAAWHRFCDGAANSRAVDLGLITPLENGRADSARLETPAFSFCVPNKSYYFACIGGVGLDAEIARRASDLPRWVRSHGGYVLALPRALAHFKPRQTTISTSDNQHPGAFQPKYSQPTFLAAFANTPVYGGGMRIAPRAEMDDGHLDVCVVKKLRKLKLLSLFPSVYFGRHLKIPEVDYFRASRLRIETERAANVFADGEYVCRTPIEVGVAPKALTVVVGEQHKRVANYQSEVRSSEQKVETGN